MTPGTGSARVEKNSSSIPPETSRRTRRPLDGAGLEWQLDTGFFPTPDPPPAADQPSVVPPWRVSESPSCPCYSVQTDEPGAGGGLRYFRHGCGPFAPRSTPIRVRSRRHAFVVVFFDVVEKGFLVQLGTVLRTVAVRDVRTDGGEQHAGFQRFDTADLSGHRTMGKSRRGGRHRRAGERRDSAHQRPASELAGLHRSSRHDGRANSGVHRHHRSRPITEYLVGLAIDDSGLCAHCRDAAVPRDDSQFVQCDRDLCGDPAQPRQRTGVRRSDRPVRRVVLRALRRRHRRRRPRLAADGTGDRQCGPCPPTGARGDRARRSNRPATQSRRPAAARRGDPHPSGHLASPGRHQPGRHSGHGVRRRRPADRRRPGDLRTGPAGSTGRVGPTVAAARHGALGRSARAAGARRRCPGRGCCGGTAQCRTARRVRRRPSRCRPAGGRCRRARQ